MLLTLLILAFVLAFGIGAVRGAPYLPILRRPAEELLDLAELEPGQTLVDLGSGDGRLLKMAAKRGYRAIGYEINPWLYLFSVISCWRYRKLVTIHLADLWLIRLPPADAIAVFMIDRYMSRLDAKIQAEITKPTVVVSSAFAIPGRTPEKAAKYSWRYRYEIQKNR